MRRRPPLTWRLSQPFLLLRWHLRCLFCGLDGHAEEVMLLDGATCGRCFYGAEPLTVKTTQGRRRR